MTSGLCLLLNENANMDIKIIRLIASELQLKEEQVEAVSALLDEGATIPFIARYRKEMTGSLDETFIEKISLLFQKYQDLEARKKTILNTIEEQGKLTEELRVRIENCFNATELEDIYLPYKPRKKTRADVARENGLEPLARMIMAQNADNIEQMAKRFVNEKVKDIESALSGARDIIAEWVNENQHARNRIRKLFSAEAVLYSRVIRGKEEGGSNFEDYFSFQQLLRQIPSHRFLAVMRGMNQKFLKVSIEPDEEKGIAMLNQMFVKGKNSSSQQVEKAVADAYKRLLKPSMENEITAVYKEKSDREAIGVFAENLRQLLLEPPLGNKRIMAIDPGFRTGCKVVCLDETGNLLEYSAIFPHPPVNEPEKSAKIIQRLIEKNNPEIIAVGNGTAGRETRAFLKNLECCKSLKIFMVSEDGASVYSASETARKEFPDLDLTVRGAVSIGRRLMDPLAELVKIDPKSIGVGQYQHDVDQNELKRALDRVTESCVNLVGVELNSASVELLTYVSGIGPQLAENIVEYRKQNGCFNSRAELLKVKRLGQKAYEQSAGFLRIRQAENPLDNSAVHPESYYIVEKMAKNLGLSVRNLIGNSEVLKNIKLMDYVDGKVGLPTLQDIIRELERPGRDPRESITNIDYKEEINDINDLREGMLLEGIVTNITAFGAFVNLGIKEDGLVHVSEMAEKFVKNPLEVVKLRQKVKVRVIKIDLQRKRIQLSMKGLS